MSGRACGRVLSTRTLVWCCMRSRTWLTACLRTVWIRYNSQHNGEHSTYSCHLQALVELNVAVALADISTMHGEEESKTEARRASAFISKSPWFQRVRDVAGIMEALIDRSRPLPPEFLLSDDTFQKVRAAHMQGEQLDMRCSPGRGACALFCSSCWSTKPWSSRPIIPTSSRRWRARCTFPELGSSKCASRSGAARRAATA